MFNFNFNNIDYNNLSFLFYINNSVARVRFQFNVKNFSNLKYLRVSPTATRELLAPTFNFPTDEKERKRLINFSLDEQTINVYKYGVQNINVLTLKVRLYKPFESDGVYLNLNNFLDSILHFAVSNDDINFYEIATFRIKGYYIENDVATLTAYNILSLELEEEIPQVKLKYFTNDEIDEKNLNLYFMNFDNTDFNKIEQPTNLIYDRYTYFQSGGVFYFTRLDYYEFPFVKRKTILTELLQKTNAFYPKNGKIYPIFSENFFMNSNLWRQQFQVGVIDKNNFYYLFTLNNRTQKNNDRDFYDDLGERYNFTNYSFLKTNGKINNLLNNTVFFNLTYFFYQKYFYFKDFRLSVKSATPQTPSKKFIQACQKGKYNDTDFILLQNGDSIIFDFSDIKKQITEFLNSKFEDGYGYNLSQLMLVLNFKKTSSISPRFAIKFYWNNGTTSNIVFNRADIFPISNEQHEIFLTLPSNFKDINFIEIILDDTQNNLQIYNIFFYAHLFPSLALKNFNEILKLIPGNVVNFLSPQFILNFYYNIDAITNSKNYFTKLYEDLIRTPSDYSFFVYQTTINNFWDISVFIGADYYNVARLTPKAYTGPYIKNILENILIYELGFKYYKWDSNFYLNKTSNDFRISTSNTNILAKNIYNSNIYSLIKLYVNQNENDGLNNFLFAGGNKNSNDMFMIARVAADSSVLNNLNSSQIKFFAYKYIDKYNLNSANFDYNDIPSVGSIFIRFTEWPCFQVNEKIRASELLNNLLNETPYFITTQTRYNIRIKNKQLFNFNGAIQTPVKNLTNEDLVFINGAPQLSFWLEKNQNAKRIIFNACFNQVTNEPNLIFVVTKNEISFIKWHADIYMQNIASLFNNFKNEFDLYFDENSESEIVYNIRYMRPEAYVNIIKNLIGARRNIETFIKISNLNLELGDPVTVNFTDLPSDYNNKNYFISFLKYDFSNFIIQIKLTEII